MFRKLFYSLSILLFAFVGASPVFAQSNADGGAPGAVYVMTNNPNDNQVIAYSRAPDGLLSVVGSYSTGGLGSGVGATVPPDPLGSQNSLLLSPDSRWLFAVNAGSDQVSSFKVLSDGSLKLVDTAASGGSYPVSLAYNRGRLFVLNAAGDGSISGFVVSSTGHLNPISGSTRSLQAATPNMGAQPNILEAPAQLGFSPDGHYLVITDKGGVSGVGRLIVFQVNAKGIPSSHMEVTSTHSPVPFSFVFDQFGHLVVVDASASSVTAYVFDADGSLSALSSALTNQAATCWIAITPGGNIFTDNTGAGSISALASSPSGNVEVLNNGDPAAITGMGTLPLDMGLSKDGRYLYSLEVGAGQVAIQQVNSDGSLTSLGSVGGFAANSGEQGIAAW